jgi:AraC-like DNA-binding protein
VSEPTKGFMTNQLNLFLLLFGSLQGFLLSFWLFRNRKHKLSNIYLAILLVVVGFQLTFKVVAKVWLMEHALIPYVLSYKLPYLIGPLLYLYAKALKENKWIVPDLMHFIPFVFFVGLRFFWSGPPFHMYTQAVFQLVSLGVYSYLAWRAGHKFVKQFILIVASAETVIIITLAVMYLYYRQFPDVRLLFTVLTFLVYWMSYKVLSNPGSLLEGDTSVVHMKSQQNSKYAHSSLKPDEAARIESAIQQLLVSNKLFIDSSLTIDALAIKVKSSRHHLSQVFNERLGKTYAEFLTDLRLTEAKMRLSNPVNFRYTIAAIALDSGFSSVSGFNEAFKRRFGQTPSQFRVLQLRQMSA